MERLSFLQAYLRNWRTIGAVTPSSHYLARRMLDLIDPARAMLVVELGAGTGAITGPLLRHLSPQARVLAVEIYPPFAEHLRRRFPDDRLEVIEGSAEALPQYLAERGLPSAAYVVSSIPFSTLPAGVGRAIVAAAYRILEPGGALVAYQYSPFHLEPLLRAQFAHVARHLVLRNLPPAFVYRAVRPPEEAASTPGAQGGPR
ncbi:MAG: methyltransferase domain-containing protein [Chloroflexi bacterium]|nr:methyltransferase domain-containing protein [Chloroflexota bacterium]